MASLIDILQHIGATNCRAQSLPDCMTGISTRKDGISTIKFQTSNLTATEIAKDNAKMAAYIVWVPCDALNEAFRALAMPTDQGVAP
jgi:hypothetical protein